ncbi:UNVERIFIED_CONTAM: hypothetical protein Sradi_6179100 [Sesamum radiatum]|uniref:Uncharacterized protein n=1 Tax=Sesamum radiatum TaxID=300843 RepID=A0AAW2K830_SESRA
MSLKHPATLKLCRWLPGCPLPQLVGDPLLLLWHRRHRIAPPRTLPRRISPALLGAIQQIISATIREQVAELARARIATPSDIDAPKEEVEGDIPVLIP